MDRSGTTRILLLSAGAQLAISLQLPASPPTPPTEPADPAPAVGLNPTVVPNQPERKPPPAAGSFVNERRTMVSTQISSPTDGRAAITHPNVLSAMEAVPRHAFVPPNLQKEAYADGPLPIGHGQTISQPYIVALMTELLQLTPDHKVLEVGTGSGYQAAVLAHLTPSVYSIEIVKPLADRARQTLMEQGHTQVHCRQGDGYFGWPEEAPFDAIIVTCAAGHLPPPLWEQLKPGGRIAIPIGGSHDIQRLVLITKQPDGSRQSRSVTSVRFVPLTRGDDPGLGDRSP